MPIKILFKTIFFIALAILQISFVSGLPAYLKDFNLILIFLVFYLELGARPKDFWWFALAGLIFDFYSPLPFGFFMIFWPAVFIFARALAAGFFTNRSLYSFFGVTFFSLLFYYFFLNLAAYFLSSAAPAENIFFLAEKNFWLVLGRGLGLNFLAIAVLFFLANLATNRLKPVFLFKK